MKKTYLPYLLLAALLLLLISLKQPAQTRFRSTFVSFFSKEHKEAPSEERLAIQLLQLENHALKENIQKLKSALNQTESAIQTKPPIQAKVIYRPKSSWRSSFWVNMGSDDDTSIEKNCPVVLGDAAIGVIDFVGPHKSLVRLITDPDLHPSTRVIREELSLAKGELHGSSHSLGRSQRYTLKGSGFNYDFADEYGPAKDLRTGLPYDAPPNTPPIHLVEEGDLLVTTGMDGVFPKGLRVAKVSRIIPLQEGDFYFDIEAEPVVENLDEIEYVFILTADK
ncbi:MAG: rod shape-determining protein MreC [Waddliaceae bacterium]